MFVLALLGCLEQVTGENVPLDCRFYGCDENGGRTSPADHEDAAPEGGGEGPWASATEEKTKVKGLLLAPDDMEVQVDVNEPDAASPGGQKRVGALHLPPGELELDVPVSVKAFRLEAFQDLEGDGPTGDDPYAQADVTLPLTGELKLELKAGARSQAAGGPTPAPAGAPQPGGGQPGSPQPGPMPPQGDAIFGDVAKVSVKGKVTAATALPVKIDFFKIDPAQPGGRTFLFKADVLDGAYEVHLPKDFGAVELEAYQDPDNNGPTSTDPRGKLAAPLTIAGDDITGADIDVK